MDVDAHGLGDLGAQILTDGAAGDAADHLTEDEAERHHVIALRGSRFPPRLRRRDLLAHPVPVGGVVPVQPGARPDHAGPVAEHRGDRDVLLAGHTELGPVPRHRGVQVEFAAIGQQMHTGAGQPLGAGEDAGQGVLPPAPAPAGIGVSAPQVDHQVAVDPHRHGRADLVVLGEVPHEGGADGLEFRGARAPYGKLVAQRASWCGRSRPDGRRESNPNLRPPRLAAEAEISIGAEPTPCRDQGKSVRQPAEWQA